MNEAPERERHEGEVAVVPLDGDLDLSNLRVARRALTDAEARRPKALVLDLRGVTFLDSSILREIVAAHVRARRDGRRFAIAIGSSEVVRRVFRVTLLEWRLELLDDPADVRGRDGSDPR